MDGALKREQLQNKTKDRDEIFEEAVERMKVCVDAYSNNRVHALDDINFRNGDQWGEEEKRIRDDAKRPALTFNHLEGFIDQVVGDQRQNKSAIKVRPVENNKEKPSKVQNIAGDNDYDLADVYSGLVRNIEYNSRADIAYDTAFDHAVGHGFGYFRFITEYSDDDTFDQDIKIKRIQNAMTVYLDPAMKEPTGEDAMYGFISEYYDRKEFERKWPKAKGADFQDKGYGENREHWWESDKIRVAEYYRKIPVKKTIAMFESGAVYEIGKPGADENEIEARIAELELKHEDNIYADEDGKRKTRVVDSHIVERYTVGGGEILDGPEIWAGKYIPIVPMWGKELNVNGETYWRGVIRHAKDAQRNYNYWETNATEHVALQPKVPFILTANQVKGYEYMWRTANTENHGYLVYNADPASPGAPQRQLPAQQPMGSIERIQSSRQNMMFTTGIHEGGLGAKSNETSGKAILARQKEGDIATFAFSDNKSRAIAHGGKILLDLIPKIYDTNRVVRIRNVDDTEDFVEINKTLEDGSKVHDLSVGKYDVVVTSGPSYNTQRMEAADTLLELGRAFPRLMEIAGDLVLKSLDIPYAEEIAKRVRKSIPQELLEASDSEEQEEQVREQAP